MRTLPYTNDCRDMERAIVASVFDSLNGDEVRHLQQPCATIHEK